MVCIRQISGITLITTTSTISTTGQTNGPRSSRFPFHSHELLQSTKPMRIGTWNTARDATANRKRASLQTSNRQNHDSINAIYQAPLDQASHCKNRSVRRLPIQPIGSGRKVNARAEASQTLCQFGPCVCTQGGQESSSHSCMSTQN